MTTVGDFVREAKPGFACGTIDPQGVFQFRMNNVNKDGALDLSKRRRVPLDAHRSLASFQVAPNDVLFNSTNSPDGVGRAGLVRGLDEPAVYSNHFLRLRTDPMRLDPSYFWRWLNLQFQRGVFLAMCRQWVNQATVSSEALLSMNLDPPSLDEQRRIAAILDKVDRLKRTAQQGILRLDDVVATAFMGLQNGGHVNHELGDVATFFGGSSLPAGEPWAGQEGGYLLMKVSDMNAAGNEIEIRSSALWSSLPGARASTCGPDAVVLPKRGASISTNKKRLTTRPTVLDPNLMAVAPDRSKVSALYLFAWFQHFDLATITSGSSVPQLNKQDLAPLLLPLPPLSEQERFGRFAGSAKLLRERLDLRRRSLEQLFATVSARAFAGEL